MRKPRNKKNENIITLDAEHRYFDNMECLPDHFYEEPHRVVYRQTCASHHMSNEAENLAIVTHT